MPEAGPEGGYAPRSIVKGRYQVGTRLFTIGDAPVPIWLPPLSVIVGRAAGLPVCKVTLPKARVAASPINRWLALIDSKGSS